MISSEASDPKSNLDDCNFYFLFFNFISPGSPVLRRTFLFVCSAPRRWEESNKHVSCESMSE